MVRVIGLPMGFLLFNGCRTSSFPFPALAATLSGGNSRPFSRMVIGVIYHGCLFRWRPNSQTGWLCPFSLGFSHLLSHFHFLKLVVPLNPFPFLSSFLSPPSLASLIASLVTSSSCYFSVSPSFFYWCVLIVIVIPLLFLLSWFSAKGSYSTGFKSFTTTTITVDISKALNNSYCYRDYSHI